MITITCIFELKKVSEYFQSRPGSFFFTILRNYRLVFVKASMFLVKRYEKTQAQKTVKPNAGHVDLLERT